MTTGDVPVAIERAQLRAATPPPARRAELVVASLVVLAFVVLSFLVAGAMAWDEWRWARHGQDLIAEVVQAHTTRSGRDGASVLARYRDAAGMERETIVMLRGAVRAVPGEKLGIRMLPGVSDFARAGAAGTGRLWLVLVAAGLVLAAGLAWQWWQYHRQARRYDALIVRGRRRAVDSVSSSEVSWGKGTRRHAVVATWIDAAGRRRRTVAGPFAYDPTPLLDPARLSILADPLDPGHAIVAPDGLPALAFGDLPAAQRQSLLAAAG